ncbi:hypothetical protein [Pseudooceanicola sp. MF1-13]|uniref:hypothetical protein n=1 Tax=Pseudooceanicola sp. MF1-13 TaxID=3379095 RepID=UPI00389161F4
MIIRTALCCILLSATIVQADDEAMPKDLSRSSNIDEDISFWEDFIVGLKRDRDGAGNVSLGQCISRVRQARIACQRRVTDGGGDGVGFERCYMMEDRGREWCFRAWDRIQD